MYSRFLVIVLVRSLSYRNICVFRLQLVQFSSNKFSTVCDGEEDRILKAFSVQPHNYCTDKQTVCTYVCMCVYVGVCVGMYVFACVCVYVTP